MHAGILDFCVVSLKCLQCLQHAHCNVNVHGHNYTALSEVARDKETALEELKRTLTSQHNEERWKLSETHLAEISKLNALLADKGAELELAEEELKRLKSAIAESEQGLGSATGQVEKLRGQVGQLQGELASTRRQLEKSIKDFSQLTVRITLSLSVLHVIMFHIKLYMYNHTDNLGVTRRGRQGCLSLNPLIDLNLCLLSV